MTAIFPVFGRRLDSTSIITYQQIIFYFFLKRLYRSDYDRNNPTFTIHVDADLVAIFSYSRADRIYTD